jgi:hypothetical protein
LFEDIIRPTNLNICIGVWRGVSKGVEDSRRPPTLWAGHPRKAQKGRARWARVKRYEVHGHPWSINTWLYQSL